MIHPDRAFREIVTLSGTDGAAHRFRDGEVVRVEVLEGSSSSRVRIRVAGKVVTASDIRGVTAGDTFRARVSFSSGSILLTPLTNDDLSLAVHGNSSANLLGLPDNAVTARLIAFFRSLGAKLDPVLLKGLSSLAARFPGREARAAEAAAILAERGIEPDENSVARLLACMEGSASGSEASEAGHGGRFSGYSGDNGDRGDRGGPGSESGPGSDGTGGLGADDAGSFGDAKRFLSFVNAKKGSDLHWVVIPFSVILSGRSCCGSVRFLLDLERGCVRETRITCRDGVRCWDFTLLDGTCVYDVTPESEAVPDAEIQLYLRKALEGSGIKQVERRDARRDTGGMPKVDVRV